MALKDVRGDTRYALERPEKIGIGRGANRTQVTVAQVVALKRCGCNGPNLGQVQTVSERYWDGIELPEGQPPRNPKLWAAYPNGVGLSAVTYSWKMDDCARQLRSWWATRNILATMKRRESTTTTKR